MAGTVINAVRAAVAARYAIQEGTEATVPDVLDVLKAWQPPDQAKASFVQLQNRLMQADPGVAAELVTADPRVPVDNKAVQVKLAPWHLGQTEGHSVRGRSKMVNILELAMSFLDGGYDSLRSPISIFFEEAGGTAVGEFSAVHLVGFGRSLAVKLLLREICQLAETWTDASVLELSTVLKSLLAINAVVLPKAPQEELAFTSVRSKFQVSESVRPCVLQLHRTLEGVLASQGGGSLKALIQKFNKQSSVAGQRITDLESKVLLHLPQQTAGFKAALEDHWQNFKVAESGCPMKFFTTLIGFEKVPCRSELWTSIMAPSPSKNELALRYAIGIFSKNIREYQRTLKKKVNIKVNAGKFRVQDPAMAWMRASLWGHFADEFKKTLLEKQYNGLEAMFFRGALDKELQQKVTLADPQIKAADFSFLQMVTGEAPDETALATAQTRAEEATESSQLALFSAKLKREQAAFEAWRRAATEFDQLQKSSRADFVQAQEQKIKEQAEVAALKQFPCKVLDEAHITPWLQGCVESYSESLGLMPESSFHIYFINFTVLGSACVAQAPGVLRLAADGLAANPSRTVTVHAVHNA